MDGDVFPTHLPLRGQDFNSKALHPKGPRVLALIHLGVKLLPRF